MLSIPLLGVLALAPTLPQDPVKTAKPVEAVVKPLSDSEARATVAAFKKSARNKKARLADRLEAVQTLGHASHKLLVKPLAKIVRSDKSIVVRKNAAKTLGHQPTKQAHTQLLKLIGEKRTPAVLAVLIDSLSSAGYDKRDWETLERLFETKFGEKYTAVQQEILALVVKHDEKQAWRLLSRHLDEPIPKDVHGANNPPAEYWEGRWKAWRVWRSEVKEALFVITGQRFSSEKEAKIWIAKNGKQKGLK